MNPDIAELLNPTPRRGAEIAQRPPPNMQTHTAHPKMLGWKQRWSRRRERALRNRTHTVIRSDRQMHHWSRTNLGLWGSRRQGIALRPFPRLFTFCALAAAAYLGLWIAVAVTTEPLADPFALAALLLIGFYFSTAPFRRGDVVRVAQLVPGDLMRQPRRPYSARIVTSVTTVNGVSFVRFYKGGDRTFEASYEASTARLRGGRVSRWHYGRTIG